MQSFTLVDYAKGTLKDTDQICLPDSVASANKRSWFTICVPLFPISSQRVWICSVCGWNVPIQSG